MNGRTFARARRLYEKSQESALVHARILRELAEALEMGAKGERPLAAAVRVVAGEARSFADGALADGVDLLEAYEIEVERRSRSQRN